jgi:hypothetical protein
MFHAAAASLTKRYLALVFRFALMVWLTNGKDLAVVTSI